MRLLTLLAVGGALILAGCASPMNVLKSTTSGGDAAPSVTVSPTGQVDLGGLNVGDTVVFAPGSMRAVVKSPGVEIRLVESKRTTDEETKKSLSVNRRDGAKIEVIKGKLLRGDVFVRSVDINLDVNDPKQYAIDMTLLAFNRGEKPFRGDLTVYDSLPPELEYLSHVPAAKYNDRTAIKQGLGFIPFVGLFTMGMDNFSRSNETVEMEHELVGGAHRYTFKRMVLEPGQAVGFVINTRYRQPTKEDLEDMRLQAVPINVQPH